MFFSKATEKASLSSLRIAFWFPTLAFTFFTWTLFFPGDGWLRLAIAGILLIVFWRLNGFQRLRNRFLSQVLLLGFFFIGEGLVWGTYRKYMDPHFQIGLYTFHIAIASFYHYFRSYDFALQKKRGKPYIFQIIAVNLAIIFLGYAALHADLLSFTRFLLDVQYFTVWVALHLAVSDYFNHAGNK